MEINIIVDDHGLEAEFYKKANQVNAEFIRLTKDLTEIAHQWVFSEAPRKTGKLKASVKKETYGTRGLVWISKSIAPYFIYVIEGTRPHIIRAKYKKALKVPGYGIFKSVQHPGTKANPFVDRAFTKMDGKIRERVNIFERWLTEV